MANTATLSEYPAGKIVISGRSDFGRSDSTLIPLAILHHRTISPGAKLVYSKLLNYAWAGARANNKRLATDLGISPRAVRNYVTELREAHLLDVQTRPGKANLYTVSTM
jgi:helix-turn-helix protein